MNADYLNPILVAVKNTFGTMIGIEVLPGKPIIKKEASPSFEVNGRINLSGAIGGSIFISIPRKLSLLLASCLLDEEKDDLDDDCIDAIKEITNMIVGNAKSNFPNDEIRISVPELFIGNDGIIFPIGCPVISMPFSSDEGESFEVDVALKTNT